jgi:hypothetical protein
MVLVTKLLNLIQWRSFSSECVLMRLSLFVTTCVRSSIKLAVTRVMQNSDWGLLVVTPCSLFCSYQLFGGPYCLHLLIYIPKMEAVCSSETLVTTYKTTRCNNPDGHNLNFHFFLFFSVPVCAITASGVPGGTLVSMNRFSTLCGWLVQRQGWRVKGEYDGVSKRDRLGLTPDLTTRDLWKSRRWEKDRGEMINFVYSSLWDFKSYFTCRKILPRPRGRCTADFYHP